VSGFVLNQAKRSTYLGLGGLLRLLRLARVVSIIGFAIGDGSHPSNFWLAGCIELSYSRKSISVFLFLVLIF
jgi:hypothetical protein